MKSLYTIMLLGLFSCSSPGNIPDQLQVDAKNESTIIVYKEFQPESKTIVELDGYAIEQAFVLDSIIIASAYSDGDLYEGAQNWGDRLVALKGQKLIYESTGVGDVYLYSPHFYNNPVNNTVLIVCEMGYEYNFGGEVFKLNNGTFQYIGMIELVSSDREISLIDILHISEESDSLKFEFKEDNLIYQADQDELPLKNKGVYYRYSNNSWMLIGL